MEIVPVMFKLERKSLLPILTITGMCKNLPMIDRVLIGHAVRIIELSQSQLKGKLIELMGHEHEIDIKEGMSAVRFYILFKTDEELYEAITVLQKELG